MPINKNMKIIYIHIPKCSGVYITKLFDMYANNFLHSTNNKCIPNKNCHIYGRTLQHYSINMILNCINTYNIFTTKNKININDYNIITIVRNPYTRFISAYNQYPNKCNNDFKNLINNRSIKEFAKLLYEKVKKEGYDFFYYGAYHQFQPMFLYTVNDKKLNIEIIKIDDKNYTNIIKQKCEKYNIKYNNIKLNTGKQTYYEKYMKDIEFVRYINFIYKKDFEIFNYDIINE